MALSHTHRSLCFLNVILGQIADIQVSFVYCILTTLRVGTPRSFRGYWLLEHAVVLVELLIHLFQKS